MEGAIDKSKYKVIGAMQKALELDLIITIKSNNPNFLNINEIQKNLDGILKTRKALAARFFETDNESEKEVLFNAFINHNLYILEYLGLKF